MSAETSNPPHAVLDAHLFRALFDLMPQLGWTALADGFIDFYNRGWYAYTGTTYEEMQGWGWKRVHDPEILPKVVERWQHSLATGTPLEMEFPLRRHDGVFRWFLTRVNPMRDPDGKIVRWVGINTDIQQRKDAEEELAKLDRAKTVFFSNVSHELRTPLTLMLGPIEDALRTGAPLAGENLQTAHRNATRLLKLVNSLLDFSRIEAGRLDPSLESVDLAALTTDLTSLMRSTVEAAGLKLVVDCPPLSAPTAIDRDMWEKIVLNLLSNAFKFTLQGEIRVSLRERDGNAELTVADTGVGVPDDQVPKLFERFHRVPGVRGRSQEGTGIGLALTQELVRIHHGEIRVESALGKGTTFVVSIPIRRDVARSEAPAERAGARRAFADEAASWVSHGDPSPPPPPGAEAAARPRVLVADDNADIRSYLRRIFAPHWEVETHRDGRSALAAARARKPAVILADVMMPGLDGFELLREVRADPTLATVPFLMLSARAGEEALVEGLAAGADDYVVKPFRSRELVARVRSHVMVAAAREALDKHRRDLYDLFMQAPAPICVVRGEELVFDMANPLYERVAGRSGLAGKRVLEALPELAGQGFDDLLRNVMRTREPVVGRDVLVRVDRSGSGVVEDTYFTFIYALLADADGSVGRVMVFCVEVTDQVKARNELESARQEAVAANRAKDEFLAILGHELRNPLSPIVTALRMMEIRDSTVHARERAVIARQTQHLMRLVDDLLDVSRIARGKVELRLKHVEIAEVVDKAIETAGPLIEGKKHRLTRSVPRSGLVVRGDDVRLAQAFSNLLMNAAKYTREGGSIAIDASAEAGNVVVRVRDDGIGMSADLLPRVFDLFVQGKRSPAELGGGLGLGLAIVRSLVELHGGRVEARSDGPGRGTDLIVSLPLATTKEEPAAPTRTTRRAAPKRILVVDDNRDAADLLADFLRSEGHLVETAYDGPSALAVASSLAPHLVFLDLGLPVMDGLEVARKLREREATSSTRARIVALTGFGQESDREHSRDAGCDDHLVKPIDPDAVLDLIATL